ncbi:MAG: BamA/TamA family outer membrane protein [Phocaeicola sp.]
MSWKNRYIKLGWFITLLIFFASCSTTKHLAEGEQLYVGVKKMEIVNQDKSDAGVTAFEEVDAALAYPPNHAILGSSSLRFPIPYGLWMYNGLYKYADKKGIGNWFYRRLASTPVYLSAVNPDTRVKIGENLLREYGFFQGKVSYSIDTLKNPKKVKLNYRVEMNSPYLYDSIRYVNFPLRADSLIQRTKERAVVKKGDPFSVIKLEEERQRLSTLFRNRGYFYFRPEFVAYRADTIQKPGFVQLQIVPKAGLPSEAQKTYRIGKTVVHLTGYNGEEPTDSLVHNDMIIHYHGDKPGIREQALRRRLYYREGMYYSQALQSYSQEALAKLNVFKYAEFRYLPKDSLPSCDTLDVHINAMFDLPYDGELEFNLKSKSTNQVGPGIIFSLTRRNFLRTAAKLSFKVKGSYEWQTRSVGGVSDKSTLNSYELGISSSLDYPRLVLPWQSAREQRTFFPAQTSFKLYVDQLNRARFFKMLSFGGNVTYDFQFNRRWKHSVTPFRLTFNTLQSTTVGFDSIMANNKSLALSLGNQFIPAMGYTITYDNASARNRNQLWWQGSVTSAGNITSLIYAAFGSGLKETNKKLLNSPYAQFLKFTSEVRHLHKITEKQHLASRFMVGALFAYGNQSIAPYSEQFYIGGANSLRAFTVRSLGPGRYIPDATNQYGYIDQTGDFKIEANLEYRFPILGDLYGALFLDAGNVWLLKENSDLPNSKLTDGGFLNSIALGTGAGVRYDLSFLVIRLDLGVALHAPYETGKSGYYNIPKFKDGLGLHFAIGYPF